MKKHLSTILIVLILIIGLSLLLYPTVANWWNELHTSSVVSGYEAIMANMSDEDYTYLFDAALDYNMRLRQEEFPLMHYDRVEGYYDLLDVTGNGVMGYVSIPKIDIKLPIYHGTSEGVLQVAVGHLQGTSLPTGGAGTHCALSAHRGLPSARLFTDLDKLEEGDIFTISVIDRLLTYQVDQILIVEPGKVEPLYAVEGEDYCTLVTCTPYAVNTHRMLVRGTRIENEKEAKVVRITADAMQIEPVLVAPLLASPILLLLLIVIMLPKPKANRRNEL